jgi:cytochrome c553
MPFITLLRITALAILTLPAAASTPPLLEGYAAAAKAQQPSFAGFSAQRGQAFYNQEHHNADGKATSCATCHNANPTQPGRNRNNKVLQPMAPSANPARLQDAATVEKWFTRNCQDVLQRACTPLEKGDFISYLRSIP